MNPILSQIATARKEAGLTQARLAKMAGLDRTTIIKLEAGKGATLQTIDDVLRALGLELHLRHKSASDEKGEWASHAAVAATKATPRSKMWKLSFPYDWSNPSISEDALVLSVLKAGRLMDIARVCYIVGLERVERLLEDEISDPYFKDEANRALASVRNGFRRAEHSLSSQENTLRP